MNNGRLWCVVNPTVGIPLFLTGVALTSLTVHHYVLSNTTWFSGYWSGNSMTASSSTSASAALTSAGQGDFAIDVKPVADPGGKGTSFVVTVTPKTVPAPDHVALSAAPQ